MKKLVLPPFSGSDMDEWHRSRWSALQAATVCINAPQWMKDSDALAADHGFTNELQFMRGIQADRSSGPYFFKYLEDWFVHDNSSLTNKLQRRGREVPDNLQEIWDVWPEHAAQMASYTSRCMDENALLAWVLLLPKHDRPRRIEEPKHILAHMRRRATKLARMIMEYSISPK